MGGKTSEWAGDPFWKPKLLQNPLEMESVPEVRFRAKTLCTYSK